MHQESSIKGGFYWTIKYHIKRDSNNNPNEIVIYLLDKKGRKMYKIPMDYTDAEFDRLKYILNK